MIFLDMDGTLIDSNRVWTDLDVTFARRRGFELTEEYHRGISKLAFPAGAEFTRQYYHLEETPEQIMAEWMELAHDAYANTIPIKPGVMELLDHLRELNRPMVLFTASPPELCRCCVERLGLTPYFKGFFYSQDTGLEKGNPAIYVLAARHFGDKPEDCVLIDDSPDNCAAAAKAGFTVVGAYDSFYDKRWEEVQQNSHIAVKSLSELLAH